MIIPFFIPHSGCPHHCVFCNQNRITGQNKSEDIASVPQKIAKYLSTYSNDQPVHLAFFGGSFTAMPYDVQRQYLQAVQPFLQAGLIHSIHISTRPDYITRETLVFLRQYHVQTVELGVQSMNDTVLAVAGRDHTRSDTVTAVKLLKGERFTIGLQLMLGLPGDTEKIFLDTIKSVINMQPDFVRLYPLLVIHGTPLEMLYKTGRYAPLSLDKAVFLCHKALVLFDHAGIKVTRIGLQPTEELERPGVIIAGPYHPAFRQLVESSIFLNKMRMALLIRLSKTDTAVFCVHAKDLNMVIGQQRANVITLKKEFKLRTIRFVQSEQSAIKGRPVLL